MLRFTCILLLSICLIVAIIFIVFLFIYPRTEGCKPTITTASGFAVTHEICAGNLIFEENFGILDKHKWQPDVSFWGGGVSMIKFPSKHMFTLIYKIIINNRTVNFNGTLLMMRIVLCEIINYTSNQH